MNGKNFSLIILISSCFMTMYPMGTTVKAVKAVAAGVAAHYAAGEIHDAVHKEPTQDNPEMTVKLPDDKTLRACLSEQGLDHFVEKTRIVQELADQNKAPLGVALSVENALYDYSQNLKNPMMDVMMQISKPQIIECILRDHPAAIESLEKEERKIFIQNQEEQEEQEKQRKLRETIKGVSRELHDELLPGNIEIARLLRDDILSANGSQAKIHTALMSDLARQTTQLNKNFSAYVAHDNALRQKAEQKIKAEEQYLAIRNATAAGFNGWAQIASMTGHKRSAQRITKFGSGATQLMDSARAFNAARTAITAAKAASTTMSASTFMSLANPCFGALSAIGSIVSIFGDDGDQSDESTAIILEAIQGLSKQMAQFEDNMMQEFDNVKHLLTENHKEILHEFFRLYQEHKDIAGALKRMYKKMVDNHMIVHGQINYSNAALNHGFADVQSNLRGLRTEDIDELVAAAHHNSMGSQPIANAKFDDYAEQLHQKAVTRSKAASLTGSGENVDDTDAVCKALKPNSGTKNNPYAHQVFSNINLVNKYMTQRFGRTAHTMPDMNESDRKESEESRLFLEQQQQQNNEAPVHLADPVIWMQCTNAALDLWRNKLVKDLHYPASADARAMDFTKLEEFHRVGQDIVDFIKRMGDKRYQEALFADWQTHAKMINEYFGTSCAEYEKERTEDIKDKLRAAMDAEAATIKALPADFPGLKRITKDVASLIYSFRQDGQDAWWPGYKVSFWPHHHQNVTRFKGSAGTAECNEINTIFVFFF